jgi:hypothetical protein
MGGMSWEGFLQTEHWQLKQRREGKLCRALGVPLAGESAEQLDLIRERDRARAERGLVLIVDGGGTISHEHLDDLTGPDMGSRTAAERVSVEWLREGVECAKKGASTPPVPKHLLG